MFNLNDICNPNEICILYYKCYPDKICNPNYKCYPDKICNPNDIWNTLDM